MTSFESAEWRMILGRKDDDTPWAVTREELDAAFQKYLNLNYDTFNLGEYKKQIQACNERREFLKSELRTSELNGGRPRAAIEADAAANKSQQDALVRGHRAAIREAQTAKIEYERKRNIYHDERQHHRQIFQESPMPEEREIRKLQEEMHSTKARIRNLENLAKETRVPPNDPGALKLAEGRYERLAELRAKLVQDEGNFKLAAARNAEKEAQCADLLRARVEAEQARAAQRVAQREEARLAAREAEVRNAEAQREAAARRAAKEAEARRTAERAGSQGGQDSLAAERAELEREDRLAAEIREATDRRRVQQELAQLADRRAEVRLAAENAEARLAIERVYLEEHRARQAAALQARREEEALLARREAKGAASPATVFIIGGLAAIVVIALYCAGILHPQNNGRKSKKDSVNADEEAENAFAVSGVHFQNVAEMLGDIDSGDGWAGVPACIMRPATLDSKIW